MAQKTFGLMSVDWEERINIDRLRRERLARAKKLLKESEVGALTTYCVVWRIPAPRHLQLPEVARGELIERRVLRVAKIPAEGWPLALLHAVLRARAHREGGDDRERQQQLEGLHGWILSESRCA